MDSSFVEVDESFQLKTKDGLWNVWMKVTLDTNDGILPEAKTLANSQVPLLLLSVENVYTHKRWTGNYSAAYLEELTKKTGNYKRFPVLVEMLLEAAENSKVRRGAEVMGEPILSLDMLTVADLQALRASVNKGATRQTSALASRSSDRVYLILTYAVAFDRVHYPFPLLSSAEKHANSLRGSNAALAQQLEAERQINRQLRDECSRLNDRAEKLAQHVKQIERERDSFQQQVQSVRQERENSIAKEKVETALQVQQLQANFEQLLMKMNEISPANRLNALSGQSSPSVDKRTQPMLEAQVSRLEQQFKALLRELKLQNATHFRLIDDRGLYIAQLEAKVASLEAPQTASTQRARARGLVSAGPLQDGVRRPYNTGTATKRRPQSHSPSVGARARPTYGTRPVTAAARTSSPSTRRAASQSATPRTASRSSSADSASSSLSRNGGKGSFKRFDPTGYVMERNAKLEYQRQLRSASPSPSPTYRKTLFSERQDSTPPPARTLSRPVSQSSIPRKLTFSPIQTSAVSSLKLEPSSAKLVTGEVPGSQKHTVPPKSQSSTPRSQQLPSKLLSDPDMTTERIDQRLRKLELFLQKAKQV